MSNPVPLFLREVARVKGMSIESAALNVACRLPELADDVLDFVGSWPQSEPAIAALQVFWRPR